MGASFLQTVDISGIGKKGGNTMLASCFLTAGGRLCSQYSSGFASPSSLREVKLLKEQEPTTVLLFGKVLIDNLIAQSFVRKPPTGGVDKEAMSAFCKGCQPKQVGADRR